MFAKVIALTLPSLLLLTKSPFNFFKQALDSSTTATTTTTTANQTDNNNEWRYIRNTWSNQSVQALKHAFRQHHIDSLAADDLPNSPFDHIGERIEPNEDGSCPMRYVINKSRTYCVFMGRLDVVENYLKTGGVNGGKYTVNRLLRQANSFIRMVTDRKEFNHVQQLMQSDQLDGYVRDICGVDAIIEPFMINLLVMLPGQALPVHYDVPLFTDLAKSAAPVWLQVALALSNLHRKKEVRQIQFVGYVNGDERDTTQGGEFVFWPEGPTGPKRKVAANPNSAIVVDGVHIAHGVAEWQPNGQRRSPPNHSKDDDSNVVFDQASNQWILYKNGKAEAMYDESDLRMSIVSRYRCYDSLEAQKEFHSSNNKLTLDDVLEMLLNDLELNKNDLTPTEIVNVIMKTYIQYSSDSDALINFNYCILPELLPQSSGALLGKIIAPLCDRI